MTEQQLHVFSALALAISIAAALLTRATLRRIGSSVRVPVTKKVGRWKAGKTDEVLRRTRMSFRFTLCLECQPKYAALRFDPAATYSLATMPLASLMWTDEQPDRDLVVWSHAECRESMIRLMSGRSYVWRTGLRSGGVT
jgi:hypothetical protein